MKNEGPVVVTEPTIRLSEVVVDFPAPSGGTKRVIDGIDLTISQGEFVTLVGKSGCGKTTILNMMAALVEPNSGSVSVAGDTARAARNRLGFMLARDALLPWRSALGNVEYGLELRGLDKKTRRATAQHWLRAVGLDDAQRMWPWQLSQGMRQRVALARTWALNPEILLMDEPFAALDVNTRVVLQEEFLRLWQAEKHRTVIFVTHDLGEAIALADRVVLIGEGRVLDDVHVDIERPRDLQTIASDPRFQELQKRFRAAI